jgi:hypothetical protein
MKFFNKDLGSRLWGMSFVLWFVICLNTDIYLWARILSAIIYMYFITFGNSRFAEDYKKLFKRQI